MAVANAENLLTSCSESQKDDLISAVQSVLKLKRPPHYIEGLDISNLQGDEAVGTTVSFVDGLPHKSGYRNYRIKAVNGIDDYAMMTELVERRVSKGQLPDLFLVDGGKGHLAVVKKVLERQETLDVPEVISIAKQDDNRKEKHDKIYVPERKNPLSLRADHPVLLLMMRIRDEAHRRAIAYHRRLRLKSLQESQLDLIPGIGAKRKRLLLRHFKDINVVATVTQDTLARVPGINRHLANNIFSFFHGKEM
jgi:excinuclease ABC subunit C